METKQHIVLVGMPGSGKTTIGKALAAKVKKPFYDSDMLVEKAIGMPITDVFEYRGEPYFRHKEAITISGLLNLKSAIIAVGGGAVLEKHTRQLLKAHRVIYLHVPPETLAKRLQNCAQRPLLNKENKLEILEKQFLQRKAIYQELANLTIAATDKTEESIAEEIMSHLCIELTL